MISDETIYGLGGALFAIVAHLLLSYALQYSKLNGELFFTAEGNKALMVTVCGIKKRSYVGIGAGIAFIVNLVFNGTIAFDLSSWSVSDRTFLVATLSLQVAYYIFQLAYIPLLATKNKSMLVAEQWVLGLCAVFQLISFAFALTYANGYSKWLNIVAATWTFGFDYFIHTLLPTLGTTFLKDYRTSLFDPQISERTQSLL